MDITSRVIRSDLIRLAKFLAPLAFTEIAIDIGEQVRVFCTSTPPPQLIRKHAIVSEPPVSQSKSLQERRSGGSAGRIWAGLCSRQDLCRDSRRVQTSRPRACPRQKWFLQDFGLLHCAGVIRNGYPSGGWWVTDGQDGCTVNFPASHKCPKGCIYVSYRTLC